MDNNWIKTFSVKDIPNEEAKEFEISTGKKIAIYNIDDNFYATDNLCTHEDASLCEGYIDGDTVECPLHQGVFRISTGEALEPPVTVNLKTYDTKVENDFIFINLE
tara:strand:- start:21 stop:338 length:318 start_codon:yes stop_codon:yes gene_type:complete